MTTRPIKLGDAFTGLFGEFAVAIMRRMSPDHAAKYLGVSLSTVRRTMRQTGMRWSVPLHKGVYDLSNGDVARIARVLLSNNRLDAPRRTFIKVRLQSLSSAMTS